MLRTKLGKLEYYESPYKQKTLTAGWQRKHGKLKPARARKNRKHFVLVGVPLSIKEIDVKKVLVSETGLVGKDVYVTAARRSFIVKVTAKHAHKFEGLHLTGDSFGVAATRKDVKLLQREYILFTRVDTLYNTNEHQLLLGNKTTANGSFQAHRFHTHDGRPRNLVKLMFKSFADYTVALTYGVLAGQQTCRTERPRYRFKYKDTRFRYRRNPRPNTRWRLCSERERCASEQRASLMEKLTNAEKETEALRKENVKLELTLRLKRLHVSNLEAKLNEQLEVIKRQNEQFSELTAVANAYKGDYLRVFPYLKKMCAMLQLIIPPFQKIMPSVNLSSELEELDSFIACLPHPGQSRQQECAPVLQEERKPPDRTAEASLDSS